MENFNNYLQFILIHKRILIVGLITVNVIILMSQHGHLKTVSSSSKLNENSAATLQQTSGDLYLVHNETEQEIWNIIEKLKILYITIQQNGGILNWNEAQMVINEVLGTYNSDKSGMKDFALEAAGGSIISTPNTSPVLINKFYILGYNLYNDYSSPENIIIQNVVTQKCYCFMGSCGRIYLELSRKIYVSAITMQHIYKSMDELLNAPKNFMVYGLEDPINSRRFLLGKFTFAMGTNKQTFQIAPENQLYAFRNIELHILDNQGSRNMTCIHRFRVHGKPQSIIKY